MIEFLCPNGHRISCPADQAGQAAKCPRCDVRFRIPELAEPVAPETPAVDEVEISQSAAPDSKVAARVSEPQIEFLCPNGHRLHGPKSLQGHPGECPECEAKFLIPTYDVEAEEQPDLPSTATPPPSESDDTEETVVHPLAVLFSQLWDEKPPGTTVKLYLADGETLIPNRFAQSLSQQNHGVFAVDEPGGTHTLTVVAWDSVVRAEVQGVKRLPEEMAE